MVNITFKTKNKGTIQHLVIDSTGLKVYGESEWKVKNMIWVANGESGANHI
ncbi:Mobile element protein [Candidatus Enterovibrio altilux]|uniref:Mobile element protein n=1 Tax=Candidatus Enterovibrio altilux TaxID=1927128 RepID=A0A291B9V9_9GAMM|nr:Mobile element protein [Candidatus Enterovibrio luxaltus]